MQPVGKVYVTTDEPEATPVTTALAEPMVALPLLMLQTPPAMLLPNVVVKPTHTLVVPVIDEGSGLTVIIVVSKSVPQAFVQV